jgi:peptide deformylase
MAIIKIARMGHPVLMRPAEPVADAMAPDIRALVRDMTETLADARGIGLAAPQIRVSKKVVILEIPEIRAGESEEEAAMPLTAFVNPEIEPLGSELEDGWEGCLSLPGLMGVVPRYRRIRYTWTTLEGERRERIAAGFHARAVQHECDHLDGILYPMRMTDLATLQYVDEVVEKTAPDGKNRLAAE